MMILSKCDTASFQPIKMDAVQSTGPVANRWHATASRQLLQHFAVPALAARTKKCTNPQQLKDCNHHQERQPPSQELLQQEAAKVSWQPISQFCRPCCRLFRVLCSRFMLSCWHEDCIHNMHHTVTEGHVMCDHDCLIDRPHEGYLAICGAGL